MTHALSAYDVAVVGAGPAGSAVALHAARGGRSVVVLEKSSWPRVKVCGGGVLWRARRHLPSDVSIPVERACRRVEMHVLGRERAESAAWSFAVTREQVVVSMTMRADLDAALLDAARASGAEVRTSCAVTGLERRAGHVELATSTGVVRARRVVAADGATGVTSRLAGWTRPLDTIPALEAEVRVDTATLARFGDVARFDFGGALEGGYGWVFGKRDHLSCGALVMRRGAASLRERLDLYLERVGVRGVEHVEATGYVIPVRPREGGFTRGDVWLVGDAAGLADPVTAEGISLALHSGRLAAEALLDSARAPERRYESSVRREIVADLRVARQLAHLLYRRPRLAEGLFRRAGSSLCEAMTDVCLGERTYRGLVRDPRNWWRLLARHARSRV